MKSILTFVSLFLLINNGSAQTKMKKIYQVLEACDFNALTEGIVDSYLDVYIQELGDYPEVKDSMAIWMEGGYGALLDSTAQLYDQFFTEQDIDEMLVFYNSRVGKKITQLTPELTTLSMRAGANWAKANEEFLKEKLAPIIAEQQKDFTYEGLYDPTEVFKELTPYEFTKAADADVTVKSETYPYQISYRSAQWEQIDCKNLNGNADLCFQSLDGQAFAMIISERTPLDLQQLKAAALTNVYNATREVEVTEVGLLEVNNQSILKMEMNATIGVNEIQYYNYYYSGDWGVVQILTFTSKAQFSKQISAMKSINNGIEILQ